MSDDRIVDAEVVDPQPKGRRRASQGVQEPVPVHIEIFAWPHLLRARAVITEKGKRRELAIDGSILILLLNYFGACR